MEDTFEIDLYERNRKLREENRLLKQKVTILYGALIFVFVCFLLVFSLVLVKQVYAQEPINPMPPLDRINLDKLPPLAPDMPGYENTCWIYDITDTDVIFFWITSHYFLSPTYYNAYLENLDVYHQYSFVADYVTVGYVDGWYVYYYWQPFNGVFTPNTLAGYRWQIYGQHAIGWLYGSFQYDCYQPKYFYYPPVASKYYLPLVVKAGSVLSGGK